MTLDSWSSSCCLLGLYQNTVLSTLASQSTRRGNGSSVGEQGMQMVLFVSTSLIALSAFQDSNHSHPRPLLGTFNVSNCRSTAPGFSSGISLPVPFLDGKLGETHPYRIPYCISQNRASQIFARWRRICPSTKWFARWIRGPPPSCLIDPMPQVGNTKTTTDRVTIVKLIQKVLPPFRIATKRLPMVAWYDTFVFRFVDLHFSRRY